MTDSFVTSLTLAAIPGQLLWDLPESAPPPVVVVDGGSWVRQQRQSGSPAARRPRAQPEPPPLVPVLLPVRHASGELIQAPQTSEGSAQLWQRVEPQGELLKLLALIELIEAEHA